MRSSPKALALAASPTWCSGGATFKGQRLQYRFNAAFRSAGDRSAYPVRIDVAVPLRAPVRYGLIDTADLAEVSAIEATMVSEVAGHGFTVGRMTRPATLHYALYVDDPGLSSQLQRKLMLAAPGRPVRVWAEQDPGWAAYRQFFRLRRRTAVAIAILLACPLLLGGIVISRFGAGWGVGAGLALLAWVVPVGLLVLGAAFGRLTGRGGPEAAVLPPGQQATRPGWLAGHENLAFAVFTVVFASLFFSILAIVLGTVLTAPYCAAIAVGLGLAITAVVWPAQRMHYANLRSRASGTGSSGASSDLTGG